MNEKNALLRLTALYVDTVLTDDMSEELDDIIERIVIAKENANARIAVHTQFRQLPHLVELAGFTTDMFNTVKDDNGKLRHYSFVITW